MERIKLTSTVKDSILYIELETGELVILPFADIVSKAIIIIRERRAFGMCTAIINAIQQSLDIATKTLYFIEYGANVACVQILEELITETLIEDLRDIASIKSDYVSDYIGYWFPTENANVRIEILTEYLEQLKYNSNGK